MAVPAAETHQLHCYVDCKTCRRGGGDVYKYDNAECSSLREHLAESGTMEFLRAPPIPHPDPGNWNLPATWGFCHPATGNFHGPRRQKKGPRPRAEYLGTSPIPPYTITTTLFMSILRGEAVHHYELVSGESVRSLQECEEAATTPMA